MSPPTDEPLGDAGTGPSKMKEFELEDPSKRDGKRPEESQQPVASIAIELRELVKRQDELLLLLRQSLIPPNPHSQGDDGVRTDGSDSDHRNHDIPDLDEIEENNRFAKSYHADVMLDNEALEKVLEETMNIFLAAFRLDERSPPASVNSAHPLWYWKVYGSANPEANTSTIGTSEKPILSLKGSGVNNKEVFDVEWDGLEQTTFGGSVIDLTKFTEVLRTEWLRPRAHDRFNYASNLLNYDLNRNPTYFVAKVYTQVLNTFPRVNDSVKQN